MILKLIGIIFICIIGNAEETVIEIQNDKSNILFQEAENSVKDLLKDPESARFKKSFININKINNETYVCGEFNAKNSYGGYSNTAQYFYRVNNKKSFIIDEHSLTVFRDVFNRACFK